jgi:23S rRNA pseudouridine2604 synthase
MKLVTEKENRINKVLQDTGLYSRREADRLIESKKVYVNGERAVLGQILRIGDSLEVRSGSDYITKELRYALYNKPVGEVTGVKDNIELKDLHPVGRLDKESEGLLIYTNDPTLTEEMLNPINKIEKEYRVKTREKMTPRVEKIMLSGMYTQEAKYAPAKKVNIDDGGHYVNITLIEGKKHEIRRMLNALNITIVSLKRLRIHNLKLGTMKPGSFKIIERPDMI